MTTQEHGATAPDSRVPWPRLIAYGMGGLVPIALFNIAGQLMGLLGNISLGLSAISLGAIMLVPRLWDALSDPIIGHLSDNTRSRWGRRRPYILFGGLAVAVSFVAMWWIPGGDLVHSLFPSETSYGWFQLLYILGGLLVFFTATTIFEIPHGALGLEMSSDYHERTKLFSAKSFLGNLFAMGTPWLLYLAGLEFFRGPGGTLADGMRFVSIFIAAALIPMCFWWFFALTEPGFAVAKEQRQTSFLDDMGATITNKTFLSLVVIIFTLATGFNFVSLFNYYITIFYLYGGDAVAAGKLLGINGTAWAITGLFAVFPLNWLSREFGKNKTLLFSISLMCAAQLSKIYCYNPELPYLAVIPTVLLSGGMLMFFTLGSSMVGDVCDEDELRTGSRSEGSYYAVYWWFMKMGMAIASLVTGVLLMFTGFDEQQNKIVNALTGTVAKIESEAEKWQTDPVPTGERTAKLEEQLESINENVEKLREHLTERLEAYPQHTEHIAQLIERTNHIQYQAEALEDRIPELAAAPAELEEQADALADDAALLKLQTPGTLFRLRLVEIALPLILSCISVVLTLRYPLTEARWREIKQALDARHAEEKRP